MKCLLIAAAFFVATPVFADEQKPSWPPATANDLVDACKMGPETLNLCRSYMIGYLHGFATRPAAQQFKQLHCIPAGVSEQELLQKVHTELSLTSGVRGRTDVPVNVALSRALHDAFPCK